MINNIPDWQNMSDQEIVDHLNEVVNIPTNKAVLFSDIEGAVGFEAANLVAGTIKVAESTMPLLGTAYMALSTTGLLLSSDGRQSLIDVLAEQGEWGDEVRDAVKALGVAKRKNWEIYGFNSEKTVEDIEALRANALRTIALQNIRVKLSMMDAAASLVKDQGGSEQDMIDAANEVWEG